MTITYVIGTLTEIVAICRLGYVCAGGVDDTKLCSSFVKQRKPDIKNYPFNPSRIVTVRKCARQEKGSQLISGSSKKEPINLKAGAW